MILVLGILAIAIALGYLFGGRLGRIAELKIRGWWLAIAGLAVQAIPLPSSFPDQTGFWALEVSYVLLLAFGFLNRRLAGFLVIMLGVGLNVAVVTVNQGMPVTRHALEASNQAATIGELERRGGAKHHLATDDDVLLPLADVIPLGPPVNQAVSVGDLAMFAGVAWFVVAAMRGRAIGRHVRGHPVLLPARATSPGTGP